MRNSHSIGDVCKRFFAFLLLTGSIVFSTSAHSETNVCDPLLAKAKEALAKYESMTNMCLMFPSLTCLDVAFKQKEYTEAAIAEYSACIKE